MVQIKRKIVKDSEKDKVFRIYRDFIENKKLTFDQYIGIASNLYIRDGGTKFFIETCEENDFHFGGAIMAVLKKMNIEESTKLRNFSPYPEDWVYDTMNDGFNTRQIKFGKVKELFDAEYLREEMQNDFTDIIENGEDGIYLFKFFVGMGKTKLLETLDNVTIASFTHEGVNELYERRRNRKVLSNKTKELPEFSEDLHKRIMYLYAIGWHEQARKLILEVAQDRDKKYTYKDIGLAMEYTRISNDDTYRALLTTHQGALHRKPIHNTLIIDEDIMQTLIQSKNVKMSDIYAMLQNLKGRLGVRG